MTRREEIEKAAMQVGGVHPGWDALECFRVGYKEGAKWADKTMIDKACEWLKNHYAPAGFVEGIFRKAMEE